MAEGLGSGPPVLLHEPDERPGAVGPVFSDDQVARLMARMYEWVRTGQEPPPVPEADDGWTAVAVQLRATFASDAAPPAITGNQLAEVVRSTYIRHVGFNPRPDAILPLAELPPNEFAAWRATALHGYNLVIADRESLADTPLAEHFRIWQREAPEKMRAFIAKIAATFEAMDR